jgi:hypothetical protein
MIEFFPQYCKYFNSIFSLAIHRKRNRIARGSINENNFAIHINKALGRFSSIGVFKYTRVVKRSRTAHPKRYFFLTEY